MTDIEKELRDALRDAAANRPPLGPIDVDAVIERSHSTPSSVTRRRPPRWLAAAAVLALVAGIGVAAVSLNRFGGAIPAIPAATPTVALNLAGTAWRAISVRGEVTRPDLRGSLPYLSFDTENEVTDGGSCHVKMGYQLVGDELTFFTMDELGVDCGRSPIETTHQKFDDALHATKTVRRTGDTLEFFNQAGAVIVVLEATLAPSTGPAPTASGTSTAYAVRVYNGANRDFDSVSIRPRTGAAVELGAVGAEAESQFVVVPYVDDQAVVVGIAHGTKYTFRMDAYRGEAEWIPGSYTYTLLDAGVGKGFFSFSGWSAAPRQPEPLQARVRNDSPVVFDHVLIWFEDGTKLEQDGLRPGATTSALSVASAYANTYAEVTVAGKRYRFAPIDNLGESRLAAGRYVWALTLSGDQLTMQVEADR